MYGYATNIWKPYIWGINTLKENTYYEETTHRFYIFLHQNKLLLLSTHLIDNFKVDAKGRGRIQATDLPLTCAPNTQLLGGAEEGTDTHVSPWLTADAWRTGSLEHHFSGENLHLNFFFFLLKKHNYRAEEGLILGFIVSNRGTSHYVDGVASFHCGI